MRDECNQGDFAVDSFTAELFIFCFVMNLSKNKIRKLVLLLNRPHLHKISYLSICKFNEKKRPKIKKINF